jgi:hypothetical protein
MTCLSIRTAPTPTGQRYASPSVGPSLVRKNSSNSLTSTGSAAPPPVMLSSSNNNNYGSTGGGGRNVGSSPMRASYSASPSLSMSGTGFSGSAGIGGVRDSVSGKRFSTPTPQSAQHHSATNERPPTPTRGWRF